METCLSNLYTLIKSNCDSHKLSRHCFMLSYFTASNTIASPEIEKLNIVKKEVVRNYE